MERKYFKLQMKSILKVYPTVLVMTVFIIISVLGCCVLLLQKNGSSEEKKKISVAVVGDLENTYVDVGLVALENFDSSRFYIDILQMQEQDAKKALKQRKINGYLYIPKDFVAGINSGENFHAKYVTLNNPTGFGTIVSEEVVEVVSDIVLETQNGIFSMRKIAKENGTKKPGTKTNALVTEYAMGLLGRAAFYEYSETGKSELLSGAEYYLCSIIVLFLLFWGISCNRIFSSRRADFARQLKLSGMSAERQVACEYAPFLVVTFFTTMLFSALFVLAYDFFDLEIPGLSYYVISDCVMLVIKIIPVIVMITLMQSALYELLSNTVSAILSQIFTAIVLGYLSGCFYPNSFFPEIVQKIFMHLPVGIGFSYVKRSFAGDFALKDFSVVLAYALLFAFVAARARNHKITGDLR